MNPQESPFVSGKQAIEKAGVLGVSGKPGGLEKRTAHPVVLHSGVRPANQYERHKCVYFIAEGARGAIKIGVTDDPAKRLAALQIGNSRPLRCLGLIDGDAYVESQWHRRFAGQRISGEWFKRTPELVAAIKAERTHTLLSHPRDGRTTRLERIIAVQPSSPNGA
jgi:hypothetical protein